jgi:hypothetical protein
MKFKKFETELDKYVFEFGKCVPFKGSVDQIIPVNSLIERDVNEKLLQNLTEGVQYSTKHIGTKQDLDEIGYESKGGELFIFEEPTSFTVPVLIPENLL